MTWFQKPPLGTPLDWGNSLNKGTVLHLAINEGHGDKVNDLSLYGNHGTLNGCTWDDGGVRFNGTSDYINCGNRASLNCDAITISVWVKLLKSCSYASPIIDKVFLKGGKLNGYGISDCGIFEFGNGTDNFEINPGLSWDHNIWYHYAITYTDGRIDFYRDGILVKTDTSTNGNIAANVRYLFIGCRGGATVYYFHGSIGEVRIQNRVLSQKEVKSYYINPWQVYLDD